MVAALLGAGVAGAARSGPGAARDAGAARNAGPPAASPGTPVLGSSALSADQLAAWYAASGVRPRAPSRSRTSPACFIDEGAAQGVRGDIAFAQSMLETGYLRFGGIVKPEDLNFSGLGACDSCPRGPGLPERRARRPGPDPAPLRVRRRRAPTPAALVRPLADARFARVQPAGRAALWEAMGNGNWATGPDYARKVLTLWRGMLDVGGRQRSRRPAPPASHRSRRSWWRPTAPPASPAGAPAGSPSPTASGSSAPPPP